MNDRLEKARRALILISNVEDKGGPVRPEAGPV
jgi:hypothetical protein